MRNRRDQRFQLQDAENQILATTRPIQPHRTNTRGGGKSRFSPPRFNRIFKPPVYVRFHSAAHRGLQLHWEIDL